jgi:hypothetical protein
VCFGSADFEGVRFAIFVSADFRQLSDGVKGRISHPTVGGRKPKRDSPRGSGGKIRASPSRPERKERRDFRERAISGRSAQRM